SAGAVPGGVRRSPRPPGCPGRPGSTTWSARSPTPDEPGVAGRRSGRRAQAPRGHLVSKSGRRIAPGPGAVTRPDAEGGYGVANLTASTAARQAGGPRTISDFGRPG